MHRERCAYLYIFVNLKEYKEEQNASKIRYFISLIYIKQPDLKNNYKYFEYFNT